MSRLPHDLARLELERGLVAPLLAGQRRRAFRPPPHLARLAQRSGRRASILNDPSPLAAALPEGSNQIRRVLPADEYLRLKGAPVIQAWHVTTTDGKRFWVHTDETGAVVDALECGTHRHLGDDEQ